MTIQQKLANRMYELLPHKTYKELSTGENHENIIINVSEPLRLADVFVVISKTAYVNSLLTTMIHKDETLTIADLPVYDVSKDNILDQSDEFCEFVYELIK